MFEPLPVDDPTRRRPDITLARDVLGWEPEVDLRSGVDAARRVVPDGPRAASVSGGRPGPRSSSTTRPATRSPSACVRCSPTPRAGEPPEIVVVDNGSRDGSVARAAARAYPRRRCVDRPAAEPRLRGRREPRHRRHRRCGRRGRATPTSWSRPGTARGDARGVRRSRRSRAAGPCVRNLDGSAYPSARREPRARRRDRARGVRSACGRATRSPAGTASSTPTPPSPVTSTGRSGAALWLRRSRGRRDRRWDEGYFMYLEDVDVGWRLRRAGWRIRVRARRRGRPHVQGLSTEQHRNRMIVEHHRSAVPLRGEALAGPSALLLLGAAVAVPAPSRVLFTWPRGPSARAGTARTSPGNLGGRAQVAQQVLARQDARAKPEDPRTNAPAAGSTPPSPSSS